MFEEKWGEVMERRTQRRVVRKSRKIRKNTFVLLTMALILCLGTLAMGGEQGVQTKTYYECVQVEKGDSIWEIAEEYKMEGTDTEQMVDEIMEVNGLKNTNIRAGESIIVPVTKAA
ncbi:MAG: LysM peptidoglycan-binding domain-containing protein [Anaerotignum sp.]|nr:LysM peptidoglycan-binding domain-containing protein [Anaerotignum sp.]